jgi:hypothetical protein
MTTPSRRPEINKRRQRKAKIALLRKHFAEAKSQADKDAILERVWKLSPNMTREEFEKPINK